jgi:hypothetical protein
VNVFPRGAGEDVRHIGRALGRTEGRPVDDGHADVAEPALERPRQAVSREELPRLRPGVAEAMPNAARDGDERPRRRLDPRVAVEEGESSLQDVVRFRLAMVNVPRRTAARGIVPTKRVRPSCSPSALNVTSSPRTQRLSPSPGGTCVILC